MSDNYKIVDIDGKGKKQLVIEYNENDEGTISKTGKSRIIASSNGFKKAGNVKISFNVIK